jgi:acyl transferase domain-containing protein/acyl carrier protein
MVTKRKRTRVGKYVAIVGMSGRFPGAESIHRFWENLSAGVESISRFSAEELAAENIDPGVLENPDFVPAGCLIENVDLFDAAFFGYSPREAESLDPQQRLFLESAWHSLEDAGYDPDTFDGSIGVYAGCSMSTYLHYLQSNPAFMALLGYLQVYIGNDKDYLATRVSYKLNLKGPSFSIQTACSTSLVACAVACGDLVDRKCDMALAGGISVRVPQTTGYYFERGGIFSPDGHCRVFDERGQGIVFGNGVGIVVLKRLEDAVTDGDSIYAVIKGWAVNNDGSNKASFTAPGVEGQAQVIALAQKRARVSPDSISYIEAHGTGTPVGDPIEIAALTKAFRAGTDRKQYCAIGSVKTNIGHLDPAAGAASLIKTALSLQHRQIPASLNCDTPNPGIDFANSPFFVNTRLRDWKSDRGPRRAGVSAFGIGGTNVHLVLEEAPAVARRSTHRPQHLLVLSARSRSALERTTADLVEYLELNPDVADQDLAYTCQIGRRAFNHRLAVVYRNRDELLSVLAGKGAQRPIVAAQMPRPRSVVFMFSGQGSQYPLMGRDLYDTEPTFRAHLDRCAELLRPHIALDIRELIYPATSSGDFAADQLNQTRIAQPALFAIEYSLAQLWMEWGIRPDAMIGHSLGEFVAAGLAGVFSLSDALALVAERGRLMQALPTGAMLAVSLPPKEIGAALDARIDIAAINERSSCVVSGPMDAIEQLQQRFSAAGVQCQRLHTSHAFHSSMMEPILSAFSARIASTPLTAPRIPYISNLTGDWISASDATNPEYWTRHIRQSVRFADGLGLLLKEPERILLEIGPGHSLSTFARRHPDKSAGHVILSSLRHPQEQTADGAFLLNTLARLWLSGARADWRGVHAHEHAHRVHLPGYPFERQRYWAEASDGAEAGEPAIAREPDVGNWFYVPSWEYTISPERTARDQISCWLVFEDDSGIGRRIANRLQREGQVVVSVRCGKQFVECSRDVYEIDPAQPQHYLALTTALLDTNRLPDQIIHAWSLGTPSGKRSETELFDYYQRVGFFSLLYIVQALIKVKSTKTVQIVAVSDSVHLVTGAEQLCPGKATLLGACKSIAQEYPSLTCRHVDIDLQMADDRALEETAKEIIAVPTEDASYTVIAFRGGQRWVQIFEPLVLDEPSEAISVLRESGVYLVTGGLGNIGLTLAEYLASTLRVRLALLTRSTFPRKQEWKSWLATHPPEHPTSVKIRRLQDIEKSGSDVLIIRADVADIVQMRGAVEQISARFGSINGVIHGAGNVDSSAFFGVDQATPELCELHFQSKVRGLIVLEQVVRRRHLDFVVLLSSISSVLAGLGYVAYSAGNIFMDAFAQKYTQKSGFPWISIDWDTWQFERVEEVEDDPTRLGMTASQGVDAFWRILSGAWLPQVVVSTGDLWARIDQWIDPRHMQEAREAENRKHARMHSRPELANPYAAPSTGVERDIAEIWQETLGIEQVGVFDNFFLDLSGSSLLATQVASQLRSKFQVELPLRRFFEGPTVAELAAVINAQRQSERGAAPMEDAHV